MGGVSVAYIVPALVLSIANFGSTSAWTSDPLLLAASFVLALLFLFFTLRGGLIQITTQMSRPHRGVLGFLTFIISIVGLTFILIIAADLLLPPIT